MSMRFSVVSAILVCSVLAAACGSSGAETPAPVAPTQRPCTEEAKVCPDGSTVSRTGPSCEFAPCPEPGSDGGT